MKIRSEETKRKDAIRKAEWARKNSELVRARMAAYYAANKKKILARSAEWAEKNRERFKRNQAQYRRAESLKRTMQAAARRVRESRAKPEWADKPCIREIYDLARRRSEATGIQWQVDHIVPINSKRVCGLHVEHNLRVIIGAENSAKGNRYWPDMP